MKKRIESFLKDLLCQKVMSLLIVFMLLVSIDSCRKTENETTTVQNELKTASISSRPPVIYWGPMQFTRDASKPLTITQKIENINFSHFENSFVLQIQNGNGTNFLVTSAIIKIDGKQIISTSDFSKKITSITKKLDGLTSSSVLDIELRGDPGTYLNIWIEGTLKLELPQVTTTEVSGTTFNSAISGGNVTYDGGSAIISRGACWSINSNPTTNDTHTIDGTGTGTFTSSISGVASNTTYYVRAYATNSQGTAYGDQKTFTTLNIAEIVTDIDGNVYHMVIIGTQVWMLENLKTTKYRNGDQIPNITDGTAWATLTTGAYCWYDNDATTNKDIYGALYNWYTVADSRNIAPLGWHVPTDAEWTILTDYLGGESVAGDKLKEIGTSYWWDPNTGTNSSGFSALPGGSRYYDNGVFYWKGGHSRWWSTTAFDAGSAWMRQLLNYDANVLRTSVPMTLGISVRCVKD